MNARTAAATVASAVALLAASSGAGAAAAASPAGSVAGCTSRVDAAPNWTPSDYVVVGVRPGHVLNLRAVPCGRVIGTIPSAGRNVHATGVVAKSGRSTWLQVTYGGRTGWASAGYLTPQGD